MRCALPGAKSYLSQHVSGFDTMAIRFDADIDISLSIDI